jgi:hypothetical protein
MPSQAKPAIASGGRDRKLEHLQGPAAVGPDGTSAETHVWAMPPLFKAAGCLAEAHVLAFVSIKTHMHLARKARTGSGN